MAIADLPSIDVADDEQLVHLVLAGEPAAFEELYRRHAPVAFRVACATAGNRDDAADAVSEAVARVFQKMHAGAIGADVNFRAYLITATRNAVLDMHRARSRHNLTGDDALRTVAHPGGTPSDRLVGGEDATLVTQAFADLPERWRAVLWLTEVEGMKPKEAATYLGVTANNAAQLAVRARSRLRERYLQAHVASATTRGECRFTVDHLGAYVAGALAPRDTAKVDQHLAGCDECTERLAELEDLGSALRRAVLPLPFALGLGGLLEGAGLLATGGAGAASAAAGAATAGGPGGGAITWFKRLPRWAQSAGAGAAVAAITAAIVVGVLRDGNPPPHVLGEQRQPGDDSAPAGDGLSGGGGGTGSHVAGIPGFPGGGGVDPVDPTSPPLAPPGDRTPPDINQPGPIVVPPPPPETEPTAQVGVTGGLGGNTGGLQAGIGDGGKTGAKLGSTELGDAPTGPASGDGLEVTTGGSALPGQTISIP